MVIRSSIPIGSRKQIPSSGLQRLPAGGKGKHTGPPRPRGEAHRMSDQLLLQLSALDKLALARVDLWSWNICGGLEGDSGKVEALVHWAGLTRIGVLRLQVVMCLRVYERVVTDFWGQGWSIHVAGPSKPAKRQGTGFLVSP